MTKDFTIPSHFVGIGSSAGGLEALQKLISNLDPTLNAAYMIVQHLSPEFKSMMSELLDKHSAMEVRDAEHGTLVSGNCIYMIPPHKNMRIVNGTLALEERPSGTGLNLSIDIFFKSLAKDKPNQAIGIILSGTGSDGSQGIKALKEVGSLIIAQNPEGAKFDGMPLSAIHTGLVDIVCSAEEIGEKLKSYISHPLVAGKTGLIKEPLDETEHLMNEIFALLKSQENIDFSKYKPTTVARRIEKRMTIRQSHTLEEYLALLREESEEVVKLGRDLLIGVTRFFRDKEAFSMLEKEVIKKLIAHANKETTIRVWISACSSGEEAFSIAILFHEEIRKQHFAGKVKIFATDINSESISRASSGVYSEEIKQDIAPDLLEKYFVIDNLGNYEISPEIRRMVVFARHNLITDAPFSNMDLVTCRNSIIYFQPPIQQRVLNALHFATRKNGFLFLGSSETLGDLAKDFHVISEKNKLFRKITSAKKLSGSHELSERGRDPVATSERPTTEVRSLLNRYRSQDEGSAIRSAADLLIGKYVPPCILVNSDQEAIHVYGNVAPYTRRLPPGKITNFIGEVVNDDLNIAVNTAMQSAKSKPNEEISYTEILTGPHDAKVVIDLKVTYAARDSESPSEGLYWIIFDSSRYSKEDQEDMAERVAFDPESHTQRRIKDLEDELRRNKESLQVTVEELETTNEELQSSNEELMSANEELQSTNEELQSVNEELYTVNSEHQEKIAELSEATSDLEQVLELSQIGIMFLDENLRIRRFTNATSEYVNLVRNDVNRPLHHLSLSVDYDDILTDAAQVLRSGKSMQRELTHSNGGLVKVGIIAYEYSDVANTSGVAITFTDVSKMHLAKLAMDNAFRELRSSLNNAITVLDRSPVSEKLNVLIIDDNEFDLTLLAKLLQSDRIGKNWNVYSETSIEAGLGIIQNKNIDICLCDFYLNSETVVDFSRALRHLNISIPVVAVTGDSQANLNAEILAEGIIDILYKENMNSAVAIKAVHYALRRKQMNDQIKDIASS